MSDKDAAPSGKATIKGFGIEAAAEGFSIRSLRALLEVLAAASLIITGVWLYELKKQNESWNLHHSANQAAISAALRELSDNQRFLACVLANQKDQYRALECAKR